MDVSLWESKQSQMELSTSLANLVGEINLTRGVFPVLFMTVYIFGWQKFTSLPHKA